MIDSDKYRDIDCPTEVTELLAGVPEQLQAAMERVKGAAGVYDLDSLAEGAEPTDPFLRKVRQRLEDEAFYQAYGTLRVHVMESARAHKSRRVHSYSLSKQVKKPH